VTSSSPFAPIGVNKEVADAFSRLITVDRPCSEALLVLTEEFAIPRASIIAIIDNFSRFLVLYPAKDASAASAAKAILQCNGIFGVHS